MVRDGARRTSLRIFPYQIWYFVDDDAQVVNVVAILHYRQDQARLNQRLK